MTSNLNSSNRETAADVRNQCGNCAGGPCSLSPPDQQRELQGWRFSLASVVFFLVPLACAIIGALACAGDADRQLLGTLAGLAIGLVVAGLFARAFGGRESIA